MKDARELHRGARAAQDGMMTTQPALEQPSAERSENDELRASMIVLGAVVEELAERVELLETRENVRKAAAQQ